MLQWSGSYIALFFSEHFTHFASFTHFQSFIQAVFFYLTHTRSNGELLGVSILAKIFGMQIGGIDPTSAW